MRGCADAAKRLERIASECGLQVMTTPGVDTSSLSVFIDTPVFSVHVELRDTMPACVQGVYVTHERDTAAAMADETVALEPPIDEELTQLLRAERYADFTVHLRGLVAANSVRVLRGPPTQLRAAMSALESDLVRIEAHALALAAGLGALDAVDCVLNSGHGLVHVRRNGKPSQLAIFAPRRLLLRARLALDELVRMHGAIEPAALAGTYKSLLLEEAVSASVHLEEASADSFVSVRPLLRACDASGTLFDVSDASTDGVQGVAFALRFAAGWAACTETLRAFDRLLGRQPATDALPGRSGQRERTDGAGWWAAAESAAGPQERHSGQDADEGAIECCVDGDVFAFTNVAHADEEGVWWVERIPFVHPQQLADVLRIVRRQLIFNTLLASCVSARGAAEACETPIRVRHRLELSFSGPFQMHILMQHPCADGLLSICASVEPDGRVRARLHAAPGDCTVLGVSDEALSRVLEEQQSIPLCMYWLLHAPSRATPSPPIAVQSVSMGGPELRTQPPS